MSTAAAIPVVINRHGKPVPIELDRITEKNRRCAAIAPALRISEAELLGLTLEVVRSLRDGMTTRQLDIETVAAANGRVFENPDFGHLSARICVSDLHRRTPADIHEAVDLIMRQTRRSAQALPGGGVVPAPPRFNQMYTSILHWARECGAAVSAAIVEERDYRFGFFGFMTLAGSYLEGAPGGQPHPLAATAVMERPGHMYMRVALAVTFGPLFRRGAPECLARPGDEGVVDRARFFGLFGAEGPERGAEDAERAFHDRLRLAFRLYDALSLGRVSFASPIMMNAGTTTGQLASCFLLGMGDDLGAIYDGLRDAALISKKSGGLSVWVDGIRGQGSRIASSGGRTTGSVFPVRLLNDTQVYVDQGGGKRRGAFAVYMRVDHPDIFAFLRQGRFKGAGVADLEAAVAAPNLKYAVLLSDVFMRCLDDALRWKGRRPGAPCLAADGRALDETADHWYLFSPSETPGLFNTYGAEYARARAEYVRAGCYHSRVSLSELVGEVFATQIQTGTPYVLFSDAINEASNMKNVGPIRSSNLCCEITIPSWPAHSAAEFAKFHPDNAEGGEYGVCTLGALCLGSYLRRGHDAGATDAGATNGGTTDAARFDFKTLAADAKTMVAALNSVIDSTVYPTEECRRSSERHRPLGIGIMGLANVLAALELPYGGPESLELSRAVAAVLYHAATEASVEAAALHGPYRSFAGSPASRGQLQPDLWREALQTRFGGEAGTPAGATVLPPDWQERVEGAVGKYGAGGAPPLRWGELARDCQTVGLRNSYVTAYMPTASTSNISGQNESFEPFTTNLYTRKTDAGQFVVVNEYLVRQLSAAGLWDAEMQRAVLAAEGSVQGIARVPEDIRRRFRTARELKLRDLAAVAAVMTPFVSQSLSLNVYYEKPNMPRMLGHWFDAWRAGLPLASYYSHGAPASSGVRSVVAGAAATAATAATTAAAAATPTEDPVCVKGSDCAACNV